MASKHFLPQHINANEKDFLGNGKIGRYVFLPGSDGRAKKIADNFDQVIVKSHPRGHHLYLGKIYCDRKSIDVASISTGMGCPSLEIILHELFNLGAKRFLRIGTCGSMQPWINTGDIVNVHAAVRDECTSLHYAPIEIPAIASLEFVSATLLAADRLNLSNRLFTGIVHCKSSLYAREFGVGPRSLENTTYLNLLSQTGILATEMETSGLFIQTQYYNFLLNQEIKSSENRVLAGAILSVNGRYGEFEQNSQVEEGVLQEILLGLETVKTLAMQELND